MLQLGPLSRCGGDPDNRRWFYNYATGVTVVRAYRTLALDDDGKPQDVYKFDLATAGVTFQSSFRIAVVGVRPKGTTA